MNTDSRPRPGKLPTGGAIVLALGGAVAVAGPCIGSLYAVLVLTSQQDRETLMVTTVAVAIAALGPGAGLPLAWQGLRLLNNKPSLPFHPPMPWLLSLLFLIALVTGQAIISFNLLAPVTFPLFHVLAIALPGLFILALVGRALSPGPGASTWRQVVFQWVWGAVAAPMLAFTGEIGAGLVLVIAIITALAVMPGGLAQLQEWQEMVQRPDWADNTRNLTQILASPLILGGVFLFLGLLIPLIEEASKSLGVVLMCVWRRPTPKQGWVWGMVSGTSFAIAEGLFNGMLNLPFWGVIVLLRLGATMMHCTTTALVGLGCARSLAKRRPWPGLLMYVISVSLHGLWNALTVMLALTSLAALDLVQQPTMSLLGGTFILIVVGGFLLLTLAMLGLLVS
jgi:hypothetical protein